MVDITENYNEPSQEVEVFLSVNSTPAVVATICNQLNAELGEEAFRVENGVVTADDDGTVPPDAAVIIGQFGPDQRGNIRASWSDDSSTTILIRTSSEFWPLVEHYCKLLVDRLCKLGLVEEDPSNDVVCNEDSPRAADATTHRDDTIRRDWYLKALKDEHPEWSQVKLLSEVNRIIDGLSTRHQPVPVALAKGFKEHDINNAWDRNIGEWGPWPPQMK
jgi:hypothetical protein